jgi:hypothetical protein
MDSDVDLQQYRMAECVMLVRIRSASLATGAIASLMLIGGLARAQQPSAPAAAVPTGPVVNSAAPDFALAGATRYGLLKTPVRLSDYRGRTVVLAFFYQARTKG